MTAIATEARPASRYCYFEHNAEAGIIGCGAVLEEAFEAAAVAMFARMTGLDAVRAEQCVRIDFEEADVELALVRWLNLLLAKAREHGLVFSKFRLERDGVVWRGLAGGEPWRAEHQRGVVVKGATLTALAVTQTPEGWEARCVLDE